VTPSRIRENFDVFDFSLDADDLAKIAALDRKDGRIGPDRDCGFLSRERLRMDAIDLEE
jgi:diketogulonate reductase-like aldo/keto reductase